MVNIGREICEDANPPPSGNFNGEEACEDHGYRQSQCEAIGDGSCCQYHDGGCWSMIGTEICPNTGSAPTPNPPPSGNLKGREACDGHGYGLDQCEAVGDGSCCMHALGVCILKIGTDPCPNTSSENVNLLCPRNSSGHNASCECHPGFVVSRSTGFDAPCSPQTSSITSDAYHQNKRQTQPSLMLKLVINHVELIKFNILTQ